MENHYNMLGDEDLMPFGKWKGTPMEDVPASYLLYLWGEMEGHTMYNGSDNQKVAEYIKDNLQGLRQEDEEKENYQNGKYMY